MGVGLRRVAEKCVVAPYIESPGQPCHADALYTATQDAPGDWYWRAKLSADEQSAERDHDEGGLGFRLPPAKVRSCHRGHEVVVRDGAFHDQDCHECAAAEAV